MEKHWNLDALYESFQDGKFKSDMKAFEEFVKEINEWAENNFKDSAQAIEKLEKYIQFMNSMDKFSKTIDYCQLTLATDVMNEEAAKHLDKFLITYTEMTKPDTMFCKFISQIENLDELINSSKLLKEHEFVIKEARAQSRHMLSEAEETLFAKMQTVGSDAFSTLVDQLSAVLSVEVQKDGELKKYPLSAVRNMAYEPDKTVRKAAYEAELKAYEQIEKPVAAALNSIKGDANIQAKMRGFKDVLDMTLFNVRMERETLDSMYQAVKEKMPSLRRFFKKKASLLGHDGSLPFYDLFAPVGEINMTFSYEEASDFVVSNFNNYSEKLGNYARHAFDNAWIDPFPHDGKSGGAFCAGIWSIKESRILSNFDGSYSDMTTLAHELGHGYHNLCLRDETAMNRDFSSPIAETASNFCETIVENAALKQAKDKEKLVILENSLTGSIQIIIDIYSRYLFESEVIKRRLDGPLSVNELKDIMIWAQKEAYSDGLDHNFLHPYMWICKSHYYNSNYNFYNFPYTYGMLFAKGLYAEFTEHGQAFLEKYDNLLAVTGKSSLEDVAKAAGIDVRKKEFWLSSLELIEKQVDEFCAY